VISEPVLGENRNTGTSEYPYIDVKNGNIYTVWQDNNVTDNSGTDIDIHYRCNLTGSTWGPIHVITEPVMGQNFNTVNSMFQCPYLALDDKLHFVWVDENNTDGSGTDNDVCYRWINIESTSLLLRNPNVTPKIGNTNNEFNFSVIYYQLNNTPPSRMKVIIDEIEYTMLEVDPFDTNYTNGKKYYFTMKYPDIGIHTYEFNASDGINFTNTRVFTNLKVINLLPRIWI
jgi:hypothetical protein